MRGLNRILIIRTFFFGAASVVFRSVLVFAVFDMIALLTVSVFVEFGFVLLLVSISTTVVLVVSMSVVSKIGSLSVSIVNDVVGLVVWSVCGERGVLKSLFASLSITLSYS
jgi:hypothetical protein